MVVQTFKVAGFEFIRVTDRKGNQIVLMKFDGKWYKANPE